MHLDYERAGGIDHLESALFRLLHDGVGYAVRAENDHRPGWNPLKAVDEYSTTLLQVGDDVPVVNDLMEHVHRRAENLERALDDLYRAHYTGAETTRLGENDLHVPLL